MDFTVAMFGQVDGDVHEKFKILMGPRWIYVRVAIITTRKYREGLAFVDRLNEHNMWFFKMGLQSTGEFRDADKKLILFRLQLLDKMDWWKEYIDLFDTTRMEKEYGEVYRREYGADPVLDSYVLSVVQSDGSTLPILTVHFLYEYHQRYQLIRRKFDRFAQGKKVGNLRHKRQSDLTEEQVKRKFEQVMDAADKGLHVFEPW